MLVVPERQPEEPVPLNLQLDEIGHVICEALLDQYERHGAVVVQQGGRVILDLPGGEVVVVVVSRETP